MFPPLHQNCTKQTTFALSYLLSPVRVDGIGDRSERNCPLLRTFVSQGLREAKGLRFEFKVRFTSDRLLARHVAAFANSRGGVIFVGVGDHGEILGLSREEEAYTLSRLNQLAGSLLPSSTYQIGAALFETKIVVYLVVEEAPNSLKPIRLATGDSFKIVDGVVTSVVSPVPPMPSSTCLLRVFVAMSFRNEEEPALADYFEAMKRAAAASGLPFDLRRIDLVEGDFEISQKIMEEIDASDIVLADFTLNPSNVYFELGYARGQNRRIIQTARKGTVLEFDVRNWKTIIYRNATELEVALKSAFREAYSDVTRGSA